MLGLSAGEVVCPAAAAPRSTYTPPPEQLALWTTIGVSPVTTLLGVQVGDGEVVDEPVCHVAEVADVTDGGSRAARDEDAVADADVVGVGPALAIDPDRVVRGGDDRFVAAVDGELDQVYDAVAGDDVDDGFGDGVPGGRVAGGDQVAFLILAAPRAAGLIALADKGYQGYDRSDGR